MKRNAALLILIFSLCLVSSGCTTKQATYSGFLDDYELLQDATDGSGAKIYTKPGVDFGRYNRIMLDRLVFHLSDESQYKMVSPEDLAMLSDYFRKAVEKNVGDAYPLVNKPDKDVLRIRAAITEIVPSKPVAYVAVTAAPYSTALTAPYRAVTGTNLFLGRAGVEAAFLDSMTGELLAEYVDLRIGETPGEELSKKILGKSETDAVIDDEAANIKRSLETWGAVEGAFEYWSKKLRKRLDEAHGFVQKAPAGK